MTVVATVVAVVAIAVESVKTILEQVVTADNGIQSYSSLDHLILPYSYCFVKIQYQMQYTMI